MATYNPEKLKIIQIYYETFTIKGFLQEYFTLTEDDWTELSRNYFQVEASIVTFQNNTANILSTFTDEQWNEYDGVISGEVLTEMQITGRWDEIPINNGVELNIPTEFWQVLKPIYDDRPEIEPYTSFDSFITDKIQESIEDLEKEVSGKVIFEDINNTVSKDIEHVTIYALTRNQTIGGNILEMSGDIISCNTSVGASGGSYTLILQPKTVKFEEDVETWLVENRIGGYDYVSKSFLTKQNGKSNIYLYHHILQEQDLIFIKFDTKRNSETKVGFTDIGIILQEQPFDMMGLVDNTVLSEDFESGDITIRVSGRDFSKMLEDDGAIFFPGGADTTLDKPDKYQSSFFLNNSAKLRQSTSFKRLFTVERILGEIQDINLWTLQPVRFWLSYILNKLSTSKVTEDDNIFSQIVSDELDENKEENYWRSNTYFNKEAVGMWQLVKLVVDPSLLNTKITDNTIASNSGSLMSFVKKICQMPFVEFFTDTYGDRFYWIARRPPFDQNAYENNYRVNIKNEDIYNLSVTFDESSYSWYKVKPLLWYQGSSNTADFYFVAAFFPEYADIFGSRLYEVESNYIDYGAAGRRAQTGHDQAIEDLKWLIRTHAYLPFSRKGSITIKGNKLIKRGMCIYLERTDELYYVDDVTQSYATNEAGTTRTTTLTISRGIVLSHIDKYFNVIDTSTEYQQRDDLGTNFIEGNRGYVEVVKTRTYNWHVDKDIFKYLKSRKQFL